MKQISIFLMTMSLAGLVITGCKNNETTSAINTKDSAPAFDVNAMKKIIEEKDNAFAKAFVTGDSAVLVNAYTQDGKIFAPNSDVVVGHAAIAKLMSQYLKFGIKKFTDETTALYGNEDNLIEEGNYYMGDEKGSTIDKGKYIAIWRKVNGDWKMYSDIFNTSLPLPPAK